MKYYDKRGKEISRDRLFELLKDTEYRRVGADRIDGWFISTVWLGIDDWNSDSKNPVIFETMVFPSEDDFTEDWVERAHSLEDALAAHQRGIDHARRKISGTQ